MFDWSYFHVQIAIDFFPIQEGNRTSKLPDGKQSPPPKDISYTRRNAYALPAF